MSDFVHRPFPRGVLIGAAAMIAFAIAAAALYRGTDFAPELRPTAAVDSKALRFEDRSDGAVVVLDAGTGREIAVLAPGAEGFVRATLRGLARERRSRDIGAEAPFQLTRWADGRVTLLDPATGRTVDLAAFGPTNAEAFARLLTVRSSTP